LPTRRKKRKGGGKRGKSLHTFSISRGAGGKGERKNKTNNRKGGKSKNFPFLKKKGGRRKEKGGHSQKGKGKGRKKGGWYFPLLRRKGWKGKGGTIFRLSGSGGKEEKNQMMAAEGKTGERGGGGKLRPLCDLMGGKKGKKRKEGKDCVDGSKE